MELYPTQHKWYHVKKNRVIASKILIIIGLLISLNAVISKTTLGIIAGHYVDFTLPQFTYITNIFCMLYFIAAFFRRFLNIRIPILSSREFLMFAFVHIVVTFIIYNTLMFDWSHPVHNPAYPTKADIAINNVEAGNKAAQAFQKGQLMGWKDGSEVLTGKVSWEWVMWNDISAHLFTPIITILFAIFYFLFISVGRIKVYIIPLFSLFGFIYLGLALTVGQKFGIQNYYRFLDTSGEKENLWYSLFVTLAITCCVMVGTLLSVMLNNVRVHKIITVLHPEFHKIERDIQALYAKVPNQKEEIHSYQEYVRKLNKHLSQVKKNK